MTAKKTTTRQTDKQEAGKDTKQYNLSGLNHRSHV